MSTPKFTVAIVGAGLSGLAFANALQKLAPAVSFVVYEGAARLSEIGAGIGIQPRSWAVMQAFGLEEPLLKVAGDGKRSTITLEHRKSDQAEAMLFNKNIMLETVYSFHRADLQRVFMRNLRSPDAVRLGKRLASYSQSASGPIELRFQDGTSATCDVLVGCDGIKSSVRGAMYAAFADAAQAAGKEDEAAALRAHIAPRFSGAVVYRSLIRKETLPEDVAARAAFTKTAMVLYCGKNRHLVTYPISNGRILNVGCGVSFPGTEGTVYDGPWMSYASKDEITKLFTGWEADVQEILKHMEGGIKWAIHVTTKLPTFIDGRVALLGDSAHAMEHHLGAGAGQCFEDAFLLAQYLGHRGVRKENVHVALQVYDEIRRPFSQHIMELSTKSAQCHHLRIPELADLSVEDSASGKALSQEQLWEVGEMMERLRDWRDHTDIMEENKVSMRRLDEVLAHTPALFGTVRGHRARL